MGMFERETGREMVETGRKIKNGAVSIDRNRDWARVWSRQQHWSDRKKYGKAGEGIGRLSDIGSSDAIHVFTPSQDFTKNIPRSSTQIQDYSCRFPSKSQGPFSGMIQISSPRAWR